jgi:hypothetical protein
MQGIVAIHGRRAMFMSVVDEANQSMRCNYEIRVVKSI